MGLIHVSKHGRPLYYPPSCGSGVPTFSIKTHVHSKASTLNLHSDRREDKGLV